jgi:hypothetical protein
MCSWGDTRLLRVLIPASLSHTGAARLDMKPVDSCIADIVDALNAAGIYTANSCCGHGKEPGSILLHDGRELTVINTENPCTQDDHEEAGCIQYRAPRT